ncbi:DUF2891 family protein [Propionibacteriaceae bacterium G1746]|uniref:DUF2891 family protein n=1 Tax=Aestuariimicrobium sp. G57 TaxID=3418485 RepID=UPI003C159398
MDEIIAARIARHGLDWTATVTAALGTSWPSASGHVALSAEDCDVTPARLHPAFHGSLDWHSAVHMMWSGLRLLGVSHDAGASDDPGAPVRRDLVRLLDDRLTPANIAVEVDYLRAHPTFERPYGWAWVSLLGAEAHRLATSDHDLAPAAARWDEALRPLVDAVAALLAAWLPNLAHPVRHGVHSNTAFALGLTRDAHEVLGTPGNAGIIDQVDASALAWFGGDVDYPSEWEPSGTDFVSPALAEADLMRRVLEPVEFGAWLRTFLPVLGEPGDVLLATPSVLDQTDGHGVHLYGLGLSRSGMLRRLAPWLDDPARSQVLEASARQYAWAAPAISDGDFMSTHWLVSFALL